MRRGAPNPRAGRRRASRAWLHDSLRAWPGFALYEAAQLVRHASESALVRHGVSWNDVAALTVLEAFGREISPMVLRTRSGIDRTTLSTLLCDLEEEGLVASETDFAHGRRRLVVATDAGRKCLSGAKAAIAEAERFALSRLGDEERERLHRLARRALPPEPHPVWDLFR